MAGQKSTVATHPRRAEIEAQIRDGVPATHIARDFGVSRQALGRFKARTVDAPSTAADADRAKMRKQIDSLYKLTLALVKEGTDTKKTNPKKFLAAVAEARRCLGLMSKIIGVLNEAAPPPVAVTVNVDLVELRACILAALVPHPQARIDVAAALIELDDRAPEPT